MKRCCLNCFYHRDNDGQHLCILLPHLDVSIHAPGRETGCRQFLNLEAKAKEVADHIFDDVEELTRAVSERNLLDFPNLFPPMEFE